MAVKVFLSQLQKVTWLSSVLLVSLVLLNTGMTNAQDVAPKPQPTVPIQGQDNEKDITVDQDLVTLTLTVTDYYGRYVSGLTEDAFTVFDNKKKQDIAFFSDTEKSEGSTFAAGDINLTLGN